MENSIFAFLALDKIQTDTEMKIILPTKNNYISTLNL